MSSNINAKNLIYKFTNYDGLPYLSSRMIDYSANNTYINSTHLNNTYGLCIDNDLYVAKYLNTIGKSSGIGPMVVSPTEIESLPDNAKFFSDAYSASIMQKTVEPLSSVVLKVNAVRFNNIKHIVRGLGDDALICTADTVYVTSATEIDNNVGKFYPNTKVKDDKGNDVVVTAVMQYGPFANKVFAGKAGKINGIFWLSTSTGSQSIPYKFVLMHLISSNDDILSMSYLQISPKMAFATKNVVYACDVVAGSISHVKIVLTLSDVLGVGEIISVLAQLENILAFTTDGSVVEIHYDMEKFIGFDSPSITQLADYSININGVLSRNGITYLATSQGLCKLVNEKIQQVDSSFSSSIQALALDNDGFIWCGGDDGKLLRCNSSDSISLQKDFNKGKGPNDELENIVDIKCAAGSLFISTNIKSYYLTVDSNNAVVYKDISGSFLSSIIAVGSNNNNDSTLYFVGKKSDTEVGAQKLVVLNQGKIESNSDITGLELKVDFESEQFLTNIFQNSGYKVNIYCIAVFKNHQYALVNFSTDNNFNLPSDDDNVEKWNSILYDITTNSIIDSYIATLGCGIITNDNLLYVITLKKSIAYSYIISANNILSNNKKIYDLPDKLIQSNIINYEKELDNNFIISHVRKNDSCISYVSIFNNSQFIVNNSILNTSPYIFGHLCKHNGHYIVLNGTSQDSTKVDAYDLMSNVDYVDSYYGFGYDSTTGSFLENLSSIYNSKDCIVINNGYTGVKSLTLNGYTNLYKKSDYIFSSNYSDKLSVIEYFAVLYGTEPEFLIKSSRLNYIDNPIPGTAIKNISYSLDGNIGLVYCTNTNYSRYIFQKPSDYSTISFNTDRITNPFDIFLNTLKYITIDHNNCVDAIILSSNSNLLSSLEISSNGIYRYNFAINSDNTVTTTYDLIVVDTDKIPYLLCLAPVAPNAPYVISWYAAKDNSKWYVYEISSNSTTSRCILTSDVEIVSLAFSNNDDEMAIRFPEYVDIFDTEYESYETTSNKIDGILYSYNNKSKQTYSSDGGVLNVICKYKKYVLNFEVNASTKKLVLHDLNLKSFKNDKEISNAFSLNTSVDSICNIIFNLEMMVALFIDNIAYKVLNSIGFYKISSSATLYKNNTATALFNGINWFNCSNDGTQTLFAKRHYNYNITDELSVFYGDRLDVVDNTCSLGFGDAYVIRCMKGDALNWHNIAYVSSENSRNIIKLRSYFGGSLLGEQEIAIVNDPYSLIAITNTNNILQPLFAYDSNVGIPIYQSATKINIVSNSTGSYSGIYNANVKTLALDASNPLFAYAYVYTAIGTSNLYVIDFSQNIPIIYLNENILDALNVVFPENYAKLTSAPLYVINGKGYVTAKDFDGNVYEVNSESILESIMKYSSFSVMKFNASSKKYVIYGNNVDGTFKLEFSGFGEVPYASAFSTKFNEIILNILPIDSYHYALQSSHYIYKYDTHIKPYSSLVMLFSSYNQIGMLNEIHGELYDTYVAGIGNAISKSIDLITWDPILYVGTNDNTCIVDNFVQINAHNVLVGRKTGNDAGLYYTYYKYYITNNTMPFTIESAYYAYEENEYIIDDNNDNTLQFHLDNYHGPGDGITIMNLYMDTKCLILDFIRDENKPTDIWNDYIDEILYGDPGNDNIMAYASNSANNTSNTKKWKLIKCTYIAKCWKSGLTELYIYLPTTYTYYIPHIKGASLCDDYGLDVLVNGRNLISQIKDNTTSILIYMLKSYFSVGNLLENTIKGNSLPLQIYKDENELSLNPADKMFHSFVCPSVAEQYSSNTIFEYHSLKYHCFGSDAQAIKLTFFNRVHNYDKKYKTIIYNTNGGTIPGLYGMKTITLRVYDDGTLVLLYWDIFEKEGSFFIGWSTKLNASDPSDAYFEGLTLSYDSVSGKTIILYACWITYRFSDNDNKLAISNAAPQEYTIAEITIDPNAKIPNNPPIDNRLIIDYGN